MRHLLPGGLVPTLTLATFVNHLNVIAWNPFLPFIAAELGVTVALLGQVPALMMLLATFLGLDVCFISSSSVESQPVCMVEGDKRRVQNIGAEG